MGARQQQVIQDRQRGKDPWRLEGAGQPQAADDVRRLAGDVVVAEGDLSRGEGQHAADEIEDGGLPGSVRPDDAVDLPLTHLQVDAIDGAQAAEAAGQPGCAQHDRRLSHGTPPAAAPLQKRARLALARRARV